MNSGEGFVHSEFNSNSQRTAKNVIVLDSSFNPPTLAHQEMICTAITSFQDSSVVISLSITNVDKAGIPEAEIQQRLLWMNLLAEDLSKKYPETCFSVILLYDAKLFIRKATILSVLFPKVENWIFLMGDDTLQRLFNPIYYGNDSAGLKIKFEQFFLKSQLVIFSRSFKREEELNSLIPNWVDEIIKVNNLKTRIIFREMDENFRTISSTKVRGLLRENPTDLDFQLSSLISPSIKSSLISGLYDVKT